MKVARFAVLASLLAGCPGPTFIVQKYAGEPRPRESIAILRANASDEARLVALDGEDIAAPIVEDGRLHIEILPAKHVVGVTRVGEPRGRFPELAFEAEANRVYRVAFRAGEPHVYEVDRASDGVVRDVTLAPPAPAPPPPAPPAVLPPPAAPSSEPAPPSAD